jgi:hypothetical protein
VINNALIFLVGFVVGVIIGHMGRDIEDRINRMYVELLSDKEPPKKPGVTKGSYHHVDEVNPPKPKKARGRVINPKTPQKMAWDAKVALEEEVQKFNVGPK